MTTGAADRQRQPRRGRAVAEGREGHRHDGHRSSEAERVRRPGPRSPEISADGTSRAMLAVQDASTLVSDQAEPRQGGGREVEDRAVLALVADRAGADDHRHERGHRGTAERCTSRAQKSSGAGRRRRREHASRDDRQRGEQPQRERRLSPSRLAA